MESERSTAQELRSKFEAVREAGSATEVRAAAAAYYRVRAAEGATQGEVAGELGLNRWTLAKWHQKRGRQGQPRDGGGVGPSAVGSAECAALRLEIERLGPRSPTRRFPPELKQRIAQWARTEGALGVGAKAMAEQLGIPWESISRWLRVRNPPSATVGKLRAVRLVGSAPAAAGGGATRGPVLKSPGGFIVEGLELPALVEVLRRLG